MNNLNQKMGNRCSCIGHPENMENSDQIEVIYIEEQNKPQEETAPIQETSLEVVLQSSSDLSLLISPNDRVRLIESRLGPYKFNSNDSFSSKFFPPESL